MNLVAELPLDVMGRDEPLVARLFAPVRWKDGPGWTCRVEVADPINVAKDIHGESSMQALALALQYLSINLYSSRAYKDGRLGHYGEFGGYLGIPSPHLFQDVAPYPF
jgi:hypothetical protein